MKTTTPPDDIDLKYYKLVFNGPVTENDFVLDIDEKTLMAASISDKKIRSGGNDDNESKSAIKKVGLEPGEAKATIEDEGGKNVAVATAVVSTPQGKRLIKSKRPVGRNPTKAKQEALENVEKEVESITADTFELGIKRINKRIEEVEDSIKGCSGDSCDELKKELAELKEQRIKFFKYVEDQQTGGQ
jgi:hypothetical protein